MAWAAVLLTAAAPAAIVVTAPVRPYAAPPVPARELARMRGGLLLPNGLDVTLGIDIQTRIDGVLALRTVYASAGSQPGVRVFTDGTDPVPSAPTNATVTTGGQTSAPVLVVDRSPTGTTIVPSTTEQPTTVNLVTGDQATWLSGAGQTQLAVTPGGPAVATPNGAVTLEASPAGAVVTLRSDTLELRQLIGQATGVVVANSADGRVIDTTSAVNVDVRGLSPALTSSIFMAQRAALEAITGR